MYYSKHYKSSIGDILLVSDEENIIGLWFSKHKYMENEIPTDIMEKEDIQPLQEGVLWLDDYFAGKKPDISRLPLSPINGTEFRKQIWQLLIEIPYGQVITYGQVAKEVAKRMGKARMSAQAVGGAVGHNPISIIIPCHRVVGSNGSLTGYGGGINNKISLLRHEGIEMNNYYTPKNSTAP